MKIEYKTTLIESDFEGGIYDPIDCIGARAVKRVLDISNIHHFSWGTDFGNIFTKSSHRHIQSFDENNKPKNMILSKLGDRVVFKLSQPL